MTTEEKIVVDRGLAIIKVIVMIKPKKLLCIIVNDVRKVIMIMKINILHLRKTIQGSSDVRLGSENLDMTVLHLMITTVVSGLIMIIHAISVDGTFDLVKVLINVLSKPDSGCNFF